VMSNSPCGEANTQVGLEKDRNIKNILDIQDMGCLDSTVFCTKRVKEKDGKGGEKDMVSFPSILPSKGKISYKIPGVGPVTNQIGDLVIPSDVKDKWDNKTEGEIIGIILSHYDEESVHGSEKNNFHYRKEWEERGVVFPPKYEKPQEDLKEDL